MESAAVSEDTTAPCTRPCGTNLCERDSSLAACAHRATDETEAAEHQRPACRLRHGTLEVANDPRLGIPDVAARAAEHGTARRIAIVAMRVGALEISGSAGKRGGRAEIGSRRPCCQLCSGRKTPALRALVGQVEHRTHATGGSAKSARRRTRACPGPI